MKKIILAVLLSALLIFTACDNIPSEVVDSGDPDYRVITVTAPSEIIQTSTESTLTTSISFENTETISSVWFNVVTDDGVASIKQNVVLRDDGGSASGDVNANDGTYTGSTVLGESVASGNYIINYYVENNVRIGNDKIQFVSSHTFSFVSSKDNIAPVLDNLIMPDTVSFGEPFIFSVDVTDDNGYVDVAQVYYEAFDPDGNQLKNSQNISKFPMFDDGTTGGDQTAKDGTFTVSLTFPASFAAGNYRFELSAEDRSGAVSNKIIHILTVE